MLPAYGDGALTRQAVDSVLGQDVGSGWSLHVVDDGQDDDLRRYVEGLDDPRATYRANPERLGINRNFQRCADLATGDLVVVLGSDDVMEPHYVRAVVAAAQRHPGAWAVHPGVRVIDAHGLPSTGAVDRVKRLVRGRERVQERERGGEELAASLLHGNWMYFPAVAFRREPLQRYGFTPGLDIVLDLDLYLRMLVGGGTLLFTDEVAFRYRRHAASLSSQSAGWGSRFAEERRYFAATAPWMAQVGWSRAARAARWHTTSRLNALSRLPAALVARDRAAQRRLLEHALTSG